MSDLVAYALAASLWALIIVTVLLARRYDRRREERQRAWDAKPSLYSQVELFRMYTEFKELDDAGLLDPGQPTEWSHAAHRVYSRGSYKDRVMLRLAVERGEDAA